MDVLDKSYSGTIAPTKEHFRKIDRIWAFKEACFIQKAASIDLTRQQMIGFQGVLKGTQGNFPKEIQGIVCDYLGSEEEHIAHTFRLEPQLLPAVSSPFCCLSFSENKARNLLSHCPLGTYLMIGMPNGDLRLLTTNKKSQGIISHTITPTLQGFIINSQRFVSINSFIESAKKSNADEFLTPWIRDIPYHGSLSLDEINSKLNFYGSFLIADSLQGITQTLTIFYQEPWNSNTNVANKGVQQMIIAHNLEGGFSCGNQNFSFSTLCQFLPGYKPVYPDSDFRTL